VSCRVFQGECSALSARTLPACRSSAPRCSCSPHAVNLVGPSASSRRLPLPYRAFAPKPPRSTSSQLYPACASTVRLAPAEASRREAALLSALPLFSACAPRSPLPRFPSRVHPARRRLPPLRPEPAHSVSTLPASRLVVGPRVLPTQVPAAHPSPPGSEIHSRHEAARTPEPGAPQNRPGLFHPGNAPELSPSGLSSARRCGCVSTPGPPVPLIRALRRRPRLRRLHPSGQPARSPLSGARAMPSWRSPL
jgi:hypothetical protein